MAAPIKVDKRATSTIATLREQRQLAKAGMIGAMGGLFTTGFFRSKAARLLHPWLGWALLGFSIWHHIVSKRTNSS
jgi:hypothetical protein